MSDPAAPSADPARKALPVLFSVVVVTRLVYLQVLNDDALRARAATQHSSVEMLTPRRGAGDAP